jgi:anti-anti-sigma regulatory factor
VRSSAYQLIAENEPEHAWPAEVTWREVSKLRDELFDILERPDCTGVRLDVRAVRTIDNTGVGLLIGANHRAAAMGRRLVLIDRNGPVSASLARLHMLRNFLVTQIVPAPPERQLSG